jgi:serine phosphatase RsbU (regulator of sigma subunit)
VLPLDAGDSLVLITDGFFESASTTGDRFGIQRLADCIRKHNDAHNAGALIRCLYDEVKTFSEGAPQADDITAVIIRRTHV